ncbi:Hypothetical predicted protein [Cloeon dipterum]|uniref:Aminopeptidase n=1 Tax=Cloeon dipterum TaxID=197152 RepID=A0A8S1CFV5_9INSE|nr:Hypothetical predicted protein [Cloeon dipterum]
MRITIFLLLSTFGYIGCTPLRERPVNTDRKPSQFKGLDAYKLPEDIIPLDYVIHLIPYMNDALPPKNFTFDGQVRILVRVDRATNQIRMHANDMTIINESINVTNVASQETVEVTAVNQTEPGVDDRHFLDIFLAEELVLEEEYEIVISFIGILNDEMEGFYRSNYFEDGEEKWMLATQFESTAARRAFPCFDEPAMKATFQLNIARQPIWIVLSNMLVSNETAVSEPGLEEWLWVHFDRSVRMSPYLVWARPDYIQAGRYANLVAPKVVEFMEEFTGHLYALPKMDEIAIPDFAAGAMENWGLVTYRETALLYDEKISTTSSKQGTASVIAHELAHQWFGNLVSPKWWSNTWLNEGFATFFAAYAGSHVETNMSLYEQFVTDDVDAALRVDALESAHPLVDDTVDSPDAASRIFDTISYSKGGSVIRMMLNFMGEENFKKGINTYLQEMKFGNADQDDLWRWLGTGVPDGLLPESVEFKDIMDTWALQAGYPLITVTRDYEANTTSFSQKRFFSTPNENEHKEVYWVPLTMVVQDQLEENDSITWLYNETITINSPAADKWLLVNNDKFGYYRVNYDKENWKKLSEAINATHLLDELSVINRAQLLMDSLVLAKAKELDYETAFDTTNYLAHEKEFTPWNAALNELSYVKDRMVAEDSTKLLFERYMKSRMGHLYEHVKGFNDTEPDEHVIRLQKVTVLSWLCSMGDEVCNEDGFALFNEWRNVENTTIHPDLKSLVYKSGIRVGGDDEYNFLYTKYNGTNDSSEISLILNAMGASNNQDLLQRLLRDSIAEDSPFKSEHARTILSAVQSNPVGTNLALDFIINNFFNANTQWGDSGSVFTSISSRLNTNEHKQKIENFLASNGEKLTETAKNNLNSTLRTLETNLQWNSDHKQTIVMYLTRKIGGNSASLAMISHAILLVALVLPKLL